MPQSSSVYPKCHVTIATGDMVALPCVATAPDAKGGEFYGPRFGNVGPAVRLPVLRPGRDAAIATLWQVSERETGLPLGVSAP